MEGAGDAGAAGPLLQPVLITGASGFIGTHLARRLLRAGHPPIWAATCAVDVAGTEGLSQACLDAGVERVVHISSIAVYGPTRRAVITEETPFWPTDPYGQSKVDAETAPGRPGRCGHTRGGRRPGLQRVRR